MWRRGRRAWLFWLLAAGAAALGGYGLVRHRPGARFEPAAFPPELADVPAIREAARDANLVLVVIDAARADHVGCYGYPRDTTPNIDRLARESLLFRRHFCQFTATKPSTVSLFTSQYSDTHLTTAGRRLLENTFTMGEGLERAGFRTALFSSNPNASPVAGIGDEFQTTRDQTDVEALLKNRRGSGQRTVEEQWQLVLSMGEVGSPKPLLQLFRSWVEEQQRSRFFAYLHFLPPHRPYLQPEEMTRLMAESEAPAFRRGGFEFPVGDAEKASRAWHPPLSEWIELYDANLRYGDWAVGQVEGLLRAAGVFDNTVFVVTSDHGEAFGEHGYLWHTAGVYDELAHIPLLMRLPGGNMVGEVSCLTESVDLLPTLFDLLGVEYPEREIQGHSLLGLMAGREEEVRSHVFCRAYGEPPTYLVRGREWAMILYGNGTWRSLYDLREDPGERSNVIARHPETAERLLSAFLEFARAQRRPPMDFVDPDAEMPPLAGAAELTLTPKQRERLRDLGYLE